MPQLSKAQQLCKIMQQTSYWTGMKDRVKSAAVFETVDPRTRRKVLALAPAVVPNNTFSLRTGERMILVLASHTKPKPGAEIKAKFKASKGTKIVSYDFNSQELVGLSAYSASYLGISGSTAFDHANIVGDKANKTDIHSLVASMGQVSRDAGKGIVYGTSYGGGINAASRTVLMWHPGYSRDKAKEVGSQVINSYRGKRNYETNRYYGGTGSQAFNKMSDLLADKEPHTPLLGTRMAPSNWPENSLENGSPSQSNWMVQSLGSNMLFCTLVANWYYADMLNLQASLGVTMHDEEIYTVFKPQAKMFAYVQQLGHCLTWCLLHKKLKIYDMPSSRAFMEVSIDNIWRKDPKKPVVTPTFSCTTLGEEYSFQRLVKEKVMNQVEKRYEVMT